TVGRPRTPSTCRSATSEEGSVPTTRAAYVPERPWNATSIARRSLDDVVVRQDLAGRREDHAGPGGLGPRWPARPERVRRDDGSDVDHRGGDPRGDGGDARPSAGGAARRGGGLSGADRRLRSGRG